MRVLDAEWIIASEAAGRMAPMDKYEVWGDLSLYEMFVAPPSSSSRDCNGGDCDDTDDGGNGDSDSSRSASGSVAPVADMFFFAAE